MKLVMATFEDRAVWAELKDEFKELLQRHEIRYSDSIESPVFSVEYIRKTDKAMKVVVQWPKAGNLIVHVQANSSQLEQDKELKQSYDEITEFLEIWGATVTDE
jgi:hypothetical protein